MLSAEFCVKEGLSCSGRLIDSRRNTEQICVTSTQMILANEIWVEANIVRNLTISGRCMTKSWQSEWTPACQADYLELSWLRTDPFGSND